MCIVLISECARRSISKTQRILDSYAIRAGIRTWITPITSEGLAELHAALRKTATRNTAVACYQNDGRHRMRLFWIVGARGKFSANGAVATPPLSKSSTACRKKSSSSNAKSELYASGSLTLRTKLQKNGTASWNRSKSACNKKQQSHRCYYPVERYLKD